ncbi:MAG: cadmium-translocating P-type ATPase [Rhodobacteraceae bacterium]|nr:cadmium-translocating P-type ATPase [Paracoccaceae bacterium]
MSNETPGMAACPACVALPDKAGLLPKLDPADVDMRRVEFSLPTVHCAACISAVERTLGARPDVFGARVNLTLKRVSITAADRPDIEESLMAQLEDMGYPARSLDGAVLANAAGDKAGRDMLARLGVAGFAMMNVMLLSISVWAGADGYTRDLMHWISAAIAFPAVIFASYPFYKSAWNALSHGRLNMEVPITLAIFLALGISLYETIQGGENAYFDAALSLTFFLLIGRYLDFRTRAVARSAASELAALEVQKARRVAKDGSEETVPMDALREGDILAVAPGERLPADGVVTWGDSELDPSMLTGETLPQAVGVGVKVRAGMLNISGPLKIRAEGLGEDTLLKQITRLVETAETTRNKYTSLAEKAARIYAPLVHTLALAAFLAWGFSTGDWRLAVNIAAAVLIITCPCALGLAVPAVLAAASGRLFAQGVLLKDGVALERLAEIDMVVFDKTGTLTTGKPVLTNAATIPERDTKIAAALARHSAHPLSRAIARAFESDLMVEDVSEHPGFGTSGQIDGTEVRLGRADWCGAEAGEMTTVWLKVGEQAPVAFLFEDELRPEAAATVEALKQVGMEVRLLSGDVPGAVQKMAAAAGIEDWTAQATPAEKVDALMAMAEAGHKVLMVGDGLNDAAALAAAHVSISPASAVDASRSSADMIIINDNLAEIVVSHRIAVASRRRILENFSIAAVYNMISVPLALAGIATPLHAALAMSTSSIIVSLNAMRIGRMK